MFERKQGDEQKKPEQTIVDYGEERRPPLIMVPKDNDFDPQFPTMFYRKGKYVTLPDAQQQEQLQFYSTSIYNLCASERREDHLACYKEKCGILRAILKVASSHS